MARPRPSSRSLRVPSGSRWAGLAAGAPQRGTLGAAPAPASPGAAWVGGEPHGVHLSRTLQGTALPLLFPPAGLRLPPSALGRGRARAERRAWGSLGAGQRFPTGRPSPRSPRRAFGACWAPASGLRALGAASLPHSARREALSRRPPCPGLFTSRCQPVVLTLQSRVGHLPAGVLVAPVRVALVSSGMLVF